MFLRVAGVNGRGKTFSYDSVLQLLVNPPEKGLGKQTSDKRACRLNCVPEGRGY